MTKLSPVDALGELNKAVAEVNGNRAGHLHLIECVRIVEAALLDASAREAIATHFGDKKEPV